METVSLDGYQFKRLLNLFLTSHISLMMSHQPTLFILVS